MSKRRDIYQEITDLVIQDLEKGVVPWEKPWTGPDGECRNGISQNAYSGINRLITWLDQRSGRGSKLYFSFKQAKSLGGHVKKGARGIPIVFYKPLKIEEVNKAGEVDEKTIPMMKYSVVFNLDDIEGLDSVKDIESKIERREISLHEASEKIISKINPLIKFGGDQACYRPSSDSIHMPDRDRFKDQPSYYSVLFHEIAHWTGHESRLKRNNKNFFGSYDYAFEELIAEMGAAFISSSVGFKYDAQHAAYIENWLRILKKDKRMLFKAAAQAQKAADFVLKTNTCSAESAA